MADTRLLEKELKKVTQMLLKICPSLEKVIHSHIGWSPEPNLVWALKDELRVLLETDQRMFESLIQVDDEKALSEDLCP